MNHLFRHLLPALLLITTSLTAQIPNASFEFWTNNLPDEWITNSNGVILPVSQSTDANTGTYAIRGQVVNDNGNPYSPSLTAIGSGGAGFPISQAFSSLTGWYKASMISSDVGFVYITIFDNSQPPSAVGFGYAHLPSTNTYQAFDVPISYTSAGTPSFASITFSIVDTGSTLGFVGSYFIIDDLAFTASTQIEKVGSLSFDVSQNPVIDDLSMVGNFKAGQSYTVQLINSIGKTVMKKVLSTNASSLQAIDVNGLDNGYYLLNVSDSKNNYTRRILISR